jgi:epoxide hydrolase-like predicted phosphatase
MMPIKSVIWDLGGVILRTEDPAPRQELADRLGMTRSDLEELVFHSPSGMRAQHGEISVEEHWENVRIILQLSVQEMPAVRQAFWDGDRIDLDLLADIRSLQSQYKIGLLSNAFSDLRRVITEEWKFADIFEEMVISSEVGVMKPDARIYHLVLERLGVLASQAVFIDDFQRNVDGARAVGIPTIHFQNRGQAWQELQAILIRVD